MSTTDEARWDAAAALHDEGMDALAAGDLDQAWNAVDAAFAELHAVLGADHPEVGHVRVSRGMIQANRGDLAGARADVEAGLAVLDAWDDPAGAPFRVRARTAHGDLLRQLGEYTAGVAALEWAADEAEALDPEDPQVRNTWNALGIALRFAGRLDDASAAYARALEHAAAHAPEDVDGRATILHNLAGLAHAREDAAAGEAYVREALALREGVGDEGPGYALDLGLLAAVLDEAGRTEEALAAYERAETAIAANFPPGHPEHAYVVHNRGDALASAGRFSEAEEAYRVALVRKEESLGAGHPEWALTQARLAEALAAQGRREEAQKHAAAAWSAGRDTLPAEHPFYTTIATVAAELGAR